jgi:hypothetical protein
MSKKLYDVKFADKETISVTRGGYPRIYKLSDGTLLFGVDGFSVRSTDDGKTWSDRADYRTNYHVIGEDGKEYALGCANSAFFQLEDGTVLVAYRATGYIKEDKSVFCTKILVSKSTDGGRSWSEHSTMCEYYDRTGDFKGVWEPHFGMLNGVLTCFYANDSKDVIAPPYQYIEYLQWIDGKWTNRTVVCDGVENKSRDGMPVWQQLANGKYVCAIEGWYPGTPELCIKLLYSDDGVKWTTPKLIYRGKSHYAGAPYVVELPTGQLVVVFQCKDNPDGGADFTNDITHMMISDGTPVEFLTAENFSKTENVFGLKEGENGMWNCLYLSSKHLYVASSGVRMKRIPLEELYKQLEK